VGDSFRSSQTNPTAANVGKFSAIVDDLVILSRGDLSTAIAVNESALQLQSTVDRIAALWHHLKRDPSISGVKKSKPSKKEQKDAIEVVKGLDPVKSPPAHDRPRLLKKNSRAGAKPTLRKP